VSSAQPSDDANAGVQRGPLLAAVLIGALMILLCGGLLLWRPGRVGWEAEGLVKVPEGVEPVRVQVGQLQICGLAGKELDEETRKALQDGRIAGIVLTERNVQDKSQVRTLCREIHLAVPAGDPPPILCVSQEGGEVSCLQGLGIPNWGPARYLVRSGEQSIQAYAQEVGQFMNGLFLNVNLAPVLDVRTNPDNAFIGSRSFSDDAEVVSRFGRAFVRGLADAKVAAVVKHFPGEGSCGSNPRRGRVTDDTTTAELRSVHLKPFTDAWADGSVDAVMVAHVVYTSLDPQRTASRSPAVLTDLLRDELGFDGVIMPDDVTATGFPDEGMSVSQACIEALSAGADLLFDPRPYADAAAVQHDLRQAAAHGELSQDALAESVERVRAWRTTLYDIAAR